MPVPAVDENAGAAPGAAGAAGAPPGVGAGSSAESDAACATAALIAAAESALDTGFPFLSVTFTGAPASCAFLMHALSVIAHDTEFTTALMASFSLRSTSV